MAALVSIGGFDFPEPSTYNATTSTIVDSARNVSGYVVGSVVRNDVAKRSCLWRCPRLDGLFPLSCGGVSHDYCIGRLEGGA